MRFLPAVLLPLFMAFSLQTVGAMFKRYQTQEVPIARLMTNLQQRLSQDTNDFETTYYLARLHSMAYSTGVTSVLVRSNTITPVFAPPGDDAGVPQTVRSFSSTHERQMALMHLTNAIARYERAILLLKRSTNADQHSWMVAPTQLGLGWCLDQAGRTNDAIAAYRKALSVAWHREVTGDFDFRKWVNDIRDDVRAGRNPVHPRRNGFIGPGVCYSEEIIGYLLRLLDPEKDADEIARLKQDQSTLLSTGRAITPILVPLVANTPFADLVDNKRWVVFDLDGSGLPRGWRWLTPKAGWLVFDPNNTGLITSALQMFGNVSFWIFWPDGYHALSSLDDNGDRELSDRELRGLAIWCDQNSDGVSDPGEVIPVEALGIKSISCSGQEGADGAEWNPRGVTFTDGETRATYDWTVPSAGPGGEATNR